MKPYGVDELGDSGSSNRKRRSYDRLDPPMNRTHQSQSNDAIRRTSRKSARRKSAFISDTSLD